MFKKLYFPHHPTLCELCVLRGDQKAKVLREQTGMKSGYSILPE